MAGKHIRRGRWSGACNTTGEMPARNRLNRSNRSKRGFTLVELMVVVTMIGILSALAIMGALNQVGYVKNTEAINMVAKIKFAQEAYRAAHGEYFDVSSGNLGECYPHGDFAQLGSVLASWAPSLGTTTRWDVLGVEATGGVQFCYSVAAGGVGDTIPQPIADESYPMPAADGPWYIIQATGDGDDDDRLTVYVSTSFSEAVHHLQEDGHSP